ncbi:MAG: DUF2332 family protein, partial [Pseudomonadota bacterium]|nr:DUF2332 family protein [Pseudomonadota bacterium]
MTPRSISGVLMKSDRTGRTDEIRAAFRGQARACATLGSPFTAALLDGLAERLSDAAAPDEDPVRARLRAWPGDARSDALALRVAGALHALVRSGAAPELAAAWPPEPQGDPADAALAAFARHAPRLLPWLDGPPQTNESARGGALLGGLLTLAARFRAPLEVLEIGASAGLNQNLDAYRFDLGGGLAWGPPASPVRIASEWRGTAHPDLSAPLEIAARAACDLAPLDPADPATRARLTAYVWADQATRLARLEAALDLAARLPRPVERADAADWLAARLARPATEGRVRVAMHSIMWQYLPAAVRAAIT